ncbi:MAG: ROK family protein [Candidatus Kerfeldbacteria bacterium]|nr:ROK family protein [Candidatus Kerfeldbacteria bacterium]
MANDYVISLDIGGTYIRGELRRGQRVVKQVSERMPKRLTKFEVLFGSLIKKLQPIRGRVRQVDIGVAGVVSGTRMLHCRNIPSLKNYNFRRVVPKMYKLTVDNDARMFLRRQLAQGVARGAKQILGFTIGTGIGRAYAENGQVKSIKAFEHQEPWERQYQRVRFRSSEFLANFLAHKLEPIIKKYQPDLIVFGGGVVRKKHDFFEQLHGRFECPILVSNSHD